MLYKLSNNGRELTWIEWIKLGGCNLPLLSYELVSRKIGPSSVWAITGVNLGQIEDIDPAAGRYLAGFALEQWGRQDLVEEIPGEAPHSSHTKNLIERK